MSCIDDDVSDIYKLPSNTRSFTPQVEHRVEQSITACVSSHPMKRSDVKRSQPCHLAHPSHIFPWCGLCVRIFSSFLSTDFKDILSLQTPSLIFTRSPALWRLPVTWQNNSSQILHIHFFSRFLLGVFPCKAFDFNCRKIEMLLKIKVWNHSMLSIFDASKRALGDEPLEIGDRFRLWWTFGNWTSYSFIRCASLSGKATRRQHEIHLPRDGAILVHHFT